MFYENITLALDKSTTNLSYGIVSWIWHSLTFFLHKLHHFRVLARKYFKFFKIFTKTVETIINGLYLHTYLKKCGVPHGSILEPFFVIWDKRMIFKVYSCHSIISLIANTFLSIGKIRIQTLCYSGDGHTIKRTLSIKRTEILAQFCIFQVKLW